jgi:hypothetical protein
MFWIWQGANNSKINEKILSLKEVASMSELVFD